MTTQLSRRGFLRCAGFLALGLSSVPLFPPSNRLSIPLKRSRLSMGSVAEITVYGTSRRHCVEATDAAFAEFDRVEKLMSVFDVKSQLSLVNRHSWEEEVAVERSIIEVLEHAAKFHRLTDGAFDVTIEPLMRLYGFRGGGRFPSDKEIGEVLDAVGMERVAFDSNRSTVAFHHRRTQIDFGGIAVGYAIDRAVQILRSYDIHSALINHSGDVFALGAPPDDDTWEIGITDPLHTDNVITTVRIKDQALSTSGNYRNVVKVDEYVVGHILDPRTGRSASNILSGTVIASSALEADALSTGFFVMPSGKASNILKQCSNVQFVAVVRDGETGRLLKFPS